MASIAVGMSLNLSVIVPETNTAPVLGNPTPSMTHLLQVLQSFVTGTGASQFDVVGSGRLSLAAGVQTLDVLGSMVSQLDGHVLSFVKLCGIFLRNNSTTAGQTCTVGAGSNPFTGWMGGTTPTRKLMAGGLDWWFSPIDGAAPVASTGDIITFDPGANTFTVDYLLVGRSA